MGIYSNLARLLCGLKEAPRAIVLPCIVSLCLLKSVAAEEGRVVNVVDRMRFAGEVKRVLIVASGSHGVLETRGTTWIEHAESDEVTCVGRVLVPQDEAFIGVLSVVFGAKGEVRSSYQTLTVSEVSPTRFFSSTQLRDLFVERRGVLRQLQTEVHAQETRLQGLQQDADAIANVSKIVSVEDELRDVKLKLQKVDEAFKSIERRSVQLKTRPAPLNADKREAELVSQLGILSTALVATENNALRKIKTASGELKRKLQLIEDTKNEHLVILEEELAELQRRGRQGTR